MVANPWHQSSSSSSPDVLAGADDGPATGTDGVASELSSTAPYVSRSGSSMYLLINLERAVE